jgi:hypothetical protein
VDEIKKKPERRVIWDRGMDRIYMIDKNPRIKSDDPVYPVHFSGSILSEVI